MNKRPRPITQEDADVEARELCHLARGAHVSQSALGQTLQTVEERGLPSACSRKTQWRARGRVANQETPYGSCLVDIDLPIAGKPKKVAISNPFAMLWRLDAECSEFSRAVRELYERQPCTADAPWNIALYFDAVSPSNPLTKGKDMRDTQCIYWSIMELQRYSQEEYWITAAACRSVLIEELPGGMSHFVKILLRTFFAGDDNFSVTGCALASEDGAVTRIFLKHRLTIADFKAHAEVLHGFGVSGLKPCPLCRSIVVHNRGALPLRGPGIEPFTSTTPSDRSWRRWLHRECRMSFVT